MLRLKREEIRSLDSYAIQTLGIPGLILMENAGRNATDAIEDYMGSVDSKAIAIVAGGGNNGGDGFVIARHLLIRGAKPVIFPTAPREKLSQDAEANFSAAKALGIQIHGVTDDVSSLGAQLADFDLIIDAVGGTGIKGALRGSMAQVAEQINAAGPDVVAVDIPTGLDCDTGKAEGSAVRAKLTVTFAASKVGFDEPQALAWTGQVKVVDIGIPAEKVHQQASRSG